MIISNNKDERTSERQNARETNAIQGTSARTRTAAANLLEIRGEQQRRRRRQKAPPPLPRCRRRRRRSSAIAQLAQQPLRCASPPPPPPMTIIAFLFAIVGKYNTVCSTIKVTITKYLGTHDRGFFFPHRTVILLTSSHLLHLFISRASGKITFIFGGSKFWYRIFFFQKTHS